MNARRVQYLFAQLSDRRQVAFADRWGLLRDDDYVFNRKSWEFLELVVQRLKQGGKLDTALAELESPTNTDPGAQRAGLARCPVTGSWT